MDFMHHFVKSAEKESLSLPVIEAQASVIILAGSETTAVAVTGAIYYVLSNPTVHEKLKKDVRETFKTADDIQLQTILKSCRISTRWFRKLYGFILRSRMDL
jgi:cytochrome P450